MPIPFAREPKTNDLQPTLGKTAIVRNAFHFIEQHRQLGVTFVAISAALNAKLNQQDTQLSSDELRGVFYRIRNAKKQPKTTHSTSSAVTNIGKMDQQLESTPRELNHKSPDALSAIFEIAEKLATRNKQIGDI